MNKNAALFAAAFALVACTNSEPDAAPQTQPAAASAPVSEAPPTTEPSAPVESVPCPGADAGTGMVKSPKPTDRCDGLFNCETEGSRRDWWLHSDGQTCFLDSMVLTPDGRIFYSDGDVYGTWKGDDKRFDVKRTDGITAYSCQRK